MRPVIGALAPGAPAASPESLHVFTWAEIDGLVELLADRMTGLDIEAIVGISCLPVLERTFPYVEAAAIPAPSPPTTSRRFEPNRSVRVPTRKPVTSMAPALGAMNKPDMVGDAPNP